MRGIERWGRAERGSWARLAAVSSANVVRIHEHGGPDVLRYEPVDLPDLEPDEVLIRHKAIGVNFIDTYHRTGLYPVELPRILGGEAAGTVEDVGTAVTEFKTGDRVAYATTGKGGYGEGSVQPADKLVPLPDGVSFEKAASVLLQGMTVEYLIRRTFRVESGMTVLWHAAAGGVGLIACQWLRHLGAKVIGTVSTDEKAELAMAHGCTHPVVYTRQDFVERVEEVTDGTGVPVAYDSVGKDTFERSLDCLSPRGMLVGFGNASGKPEPLDPLVLAQKGSLFVTRPTLFHYAATRDELLASAKEVLDLVADGVIDARPRHRYTLRDADQVHRDLEGRKTSGSIVMLP